MISQFLVVERPARRELLGRVAELVASAFGQPDCLAVRVAFDGHEASTRGFHKGRGRLATEFTTAAGKRGRIEIVDLGSGSRPRESLLKEDHALIKIVAEELTAHFNCEAADRARRDSETRLQQIAGSMLDMVIQIDHEGVIRYLSSSMVSTFGRPAEAVLGHKPGEFIHDEDRQAGAGFIRAVLDGGVDERLELRVRTSDGDYIPIEAVGNPLRDDSGRIVGAILALRDITDRQRAEEALRRSEAHFRSLIENAPDLITVIDPGGIIYYESPSVERYVGFTAAEMIGRSAFDLIHPEDAGQVVEAVRRLPGGSG